MSMEELDGGLIVLCRVRRVMVALRLRDVVEVMRPLSLERLADMPPFVLGISLIRGKPTLVIDAGALLEAVDERRSVRFVTLRTGERIVALAVEEILGVQRLDVNALQELPPLLGDAHRELICAVGVVDAELLVVLNAARVVPDSIWRNVDGHRSHA